jgi:hypothetical protein
MPRKLLCGELSALNADRSMLLQINRSGIIQNKTQTQVCSRNIYCKRYGKWLLLLLMTTLNSIGNEEMIANQELRRHTM